MATLPTKEMSFEPADGSRFRRALGSLAAGVNVITVLDPDGVARGMTATSVCSVSAEPFLVLACVNRVTRSHHWILATGRFGVSILGASATQISEYCARPGTDKELDAAWLVEPPPSRSPALVDALAHLDCAVAGVHDGGTHSVILGQVNDVGLAEGGEPLVYFRGGYHRLSQELAP